MAIGFRGSATASLDGGTVFNVPVPVGVQNGDFMLAHISYRQGQNSAVTAPTGWTLVRSDGSFPDSGGVSGYIFYRVATGSEPAAYPFTLQDFREAAGGIVAYTGVKNTNPIDVHSGATSISTTTPTSPTISTLYTAPWLIWFLAARDNASTDTATVPSGMTERWRINAPAPGCVSLVAEQIFAGPGNSGALSGTIAPTGHTVAQALFLNPADESPNHPPIVSAGPDKFSEVGSSVTFDGSGSDVDPDDTLTFAWTHISGPHSTADLSDPNSATPLFTPTITGSDVFRLTVTDHPTGANNSDDMTVSTLPTGVRFNNATGLSTVATCTIPTDAVINDVAFFAVCSRPNSPPVASSGWGAVIESSVGSSTTDLSLFVFAKRLTIGDLGGSVSATYPTLFDFTWAAQVVTIRGLHTTILQNLQIATQPLRSPNNFANSIVGTPGSTTYEYIITAIDDAGETVAATTVTMTNAPDTLSASDYVRLTWQPTNRALAYNIYGRTASDPRLIATIDRTPIDPLENVVGYRDQGATPTSQQPPTQQPVDWLMDGLNDDWEGTLLQERLFTTYANARLLVFSAAHLLAPNASVIVNEPAGMNPIATSLANTNDVLVHSTIETLGAAGNVGIRLFTPSDYTDVWTTVGLTLRPSNANGTPTARAGYDQAAEVGATVYLDGSESYDDDGDVLTYAWTQTVGPNVTLTNPTSIFPTFTMPNGSVTFQLTVTDPGNAQSNDFVTVVVVDAGLKVKRPNNTWDIIN